MKKLLPLLFLAGCTTTGPLNVKDIRVGQVLTGATADTKKCSIEVYNIMTLGNTAHGFATYPNPVVCGPATCTDEGSEMKGKYEDTVCVLLKDLQETPTNGDSNDHPRRQNPF